MALNYTNFNHEVSENPCSLSLCIVNASLLPPAESHQSNWCTTHKYTQSADTEHNLEVCHERQPIAAAAAAATTTTTTPISFQPTHTASLHLSISVALNLKIESLC